MQLRPDIILIGPARIGKSTTAAVLAEQLGVPRVSMDDHRFGYYRELGYDDAFAKRILEAEGPRGLYRYWKVFDGYSVERLLADYRDCVIDMGGGSTVCEYEDQLARLQRAFEPYPNVFLLLPFADPEKSIEFLNERTGWSGSDTNPNAHFVRHPSNARLAKDTVYVAGLTPREVADEILDIRGRSLGREC